jgi:hypothetical protein
MTKQEKLNNVDWLLVHSTKNIPWTGNGENLQDNMIMFSPLVMPTDTQHNRDIGHYKPENAKMSIRASQGHDKDEIFVYTFASLQDVQSIYLHLKSELEKHNLLP